MVLVDASQSIAINKIYTLNILVPNRIFFNIIIRSMSVIPVIITENIKRSKQNKKTIRQTKKKSRPPPWFNTYWVI